MKVTLEQEVVVNCIVEYEVPQDESLTIFLSQHKTISSDVLDGIEDLATSKKVKMNDSIIEVLNSKVIPNYEG